MKSIRENLPLLILIGVLIPCFVLGFKARADQANQMQTYINNATNIAKTEIYCDNLQVELKADKIIGSDFQPAINIMQDRLNKGDCK